MNRGHAAVFVGRVHSKFREWVFDAGLYDRVLFQNRLILDEVGSRSGTLPWWRWADAGVSRNTRARLLIWSMKKDGVPVSKSQQE